ncbi:MAG: adenosylcobalamin-dependent ribonucleoside-diphosphate reductase [Mycobacteriales bacterium]
MIPEVLEAKLGRRLPSEAAAIRAGVRGDTRRETAEQILDRVSGTLGDVERRYGAGGPEAAAWAGRFRDLMADNRFWPSGRILNNCGAAQGQLASCFVLPIDDDFGSVLEALTLAARCHRTGGGTGFDLSGMRERGAPIATAEAAGASGPVSWLDLFDAETSVVMQGGKMRGANLAALSVRHPDVLEFIDAKSVVGRLSCFNLSVSVDDRFFAQLDAGERIDLVSPVDGRVVHTLPAAEIWQQIAENAWRTGDPGVLFVDAINRHNVLLDHLGPIRTTNPCGEQTLYPYEASNLGSLNLRAFLRPAGAGGPAVDWAALEESVEQAVRLLDDAIDASVYPDPRITAMAQANRRIGLGVMGFADLLVALGIPYDSDECLALVDRLGACIRDAGRRGSERLAAERGPFPHWEHSTLRTPARNCAVTTIAPTGTISMVAGCSSGIEPRFAAAWNKDVLTADGLDFVDADLVADVMRVTGGSEAEASAAVSARGVEALPPGDPARRRYRYAYDVSGQWHVRVAAQWQRWIDNAVSKTVNMPRHATAADVADALRASWEAGCKGISVYRQGSRERDLLQAVEHAEGRLAQSKALLLATGSAR